MTKYLDPVLIILFGIIARSKYIGILKSNVDMALSLDVKGVTSFVDAQACQV